MNVAAFPADEETRLLDLYSYELIGTPPETDFNEIVELAAQICDCSTALITLLDRDRQFIKASKGFSEKQIGRTGELWNLEKWSQGVFVTADGQADKCFWQNELFQQHGMRSFAACALFSPEQQLLGFLCVMDSNVNHFDAAALKQLRMLANQVQQLFELRKSSALLKKNAEEIVELKTKNIGRVLQGREDDKMHIATTLHEDIAQRIASDILLIDLAIKNQDRAFSIAGEIRQNLKDILADIRTLTYSIIPYSLHIIPADDLVAEFADKISNEHGFDINVTIDKTDKKATPENALSAIRILEQWFKFLAEKKTIVAFNLSIETDTHFRLFLEFNSSRQEYLDLQMKLDDSMIADRVYSLNGTIEYSYQKSKNMLSVALPVIPKVTN